MPFAIAGCCRNLSRQAALVLACALPLLGCTSAEETFFAIIEPPNPSILEGDYLRMSDNYAGSELRHWSVDDPTIATIVPASDDGGNKVTVEAVTPGTTTLHVTVAGVSINAATTITVKRRDVTTVTVTPAASSVVAGGTVQLAAVAKAGAVTVSNRPTLWSSNSSNFAVDGTGLVTVAAGVQPGAVGTITAAVVNGGSGEVSGIATITVVASTLAFTVAPFSVSMTQGGSGFVAVIIDRTKYRDVASFSLSGLPQGVTASLNPANPVPGTSGGPNITLAADANATPGEYTVTVSGIGVDVQPASATFQLAISPSSGFTFSLTPDFFTMPAGTGSSTAIRVFRSTVNPVTFTYSSPDGITGTFAPNPVPNTLTGSVFTFTVPTGLPSGFYNVTVTGTATGVAPQSKTFSVLVPPTGSGGTATIGNNSGGSLASVWQGTTQINSSGASFSVAVPGQITAFNSVAGVTYGRSFQLSGAFYGDPVFKRVFDEAMVTKPEGTMFFTVQGFAQLVFGFDVTGLGTQSRLFNTGTTVPGALSQVKLGDPIIAAVLRSGPDLSSAGVVGLFGAILPANFTTLDLSTAVAPARVPVVVNGAGSATGFLALDLQSTQGQYADRVTFAAPQVGTFTGSGPTTLPLFPSVPAGTVQALTAIATPAGSLRLLGVTAYYGAAPASATLQLGPVSTQATTVTKLANPTFAQFQVTIPFDPAYNGGYTIEITGQQGGHALYTAWISPFVINGATYVFTVPNIPAMAQVLPLGPAYTVGVTRMGGYANLQSLFMPVPVAGTAVIFDRSAVIVP